MLLGGGHNPSAWLELADGRTAHDVARSAAGLRRLAAGNDFLGIAVETTTDHAVDAWIAPIETVSNSEAGFELVYQGSAALLVEPLRLRPGERWALRIGQQATVAAERVVAGPPDGIDADAAPARSSAEPAAAVPGSSVGAGHGAAPLE